MRVQSNRRIKRINNIVDRNIVINVKIYGRDRVVKIYFYECIDDMHRYTVEVKT